MNRPESSHGAREAALPKLKSKPSRHILDDDSHDETNYEALAVRSSPHKPVASKDDDLEEFLSDDSVPARKPSKASSSSREPVPPPALEVKKARGRPAGMKNKQKDDAATAKAPAAKAKAKAAPKAAPKAAAKPLPLSPAAKAYSASKEAKKPAKKTVFSDDDDDSDDMMVDADDAEPSSPPPRPAARGRPGRAAAKKKPTYIIDDDDESSMAMDEPQDDGFSDSD
ncbi:hypothetical protein HYQ45_015517 [Verticillium longisporum]|nr:hypothetical protein HYQ45_015517 [Verticillium longisporum]